MIKDGGLAGNSVGLGMVKGLKIRFLSVRQVYEKYIA